MKQENSKCTSEHEAAISIDNVWEHFRLYHERGRTLRHALIRLGRNKYEDFWALKGVSLEINKGDTFALIGENGSGKSTLLKCIARVIEPTKGSISVNGKISALLELGAGFHDDLTGRENVYLNGAILGCSKKEMDKIFDEIVQFAELEQFIDSPIRNYSSGMYVRLGFAVAVHLDFDILLVDEVLAVGDAAFQAKCFRKIDDFRRQGKTIVFVSHSLEQVRRVCNKAVWLNEGEVRASGYVDDVIGAYLGYIREKEEEKMRQAGEKFRCLETNTNKEINKLSIKRVGILNEKNEFSSTFITGDKLIIEVECEVTGVIKEPDFAISIWTPAGLLISSDNTKLLDNRLVNQLEGICVYRYTIPELSLLPGSYLLSTSVFDENELRYDASFLRTEFKVMKISKPQPPGLFKLGGYWGLGLEESASE